MKLGIIAPPVENSFIDAKGRGLDFLEFCVNYGYNTDEFFGDLDKIRSWIKKYGVKVASIGRWKNEVIESTGKISSAELEMSMKLIDAAQYLECSNYVCGCNYIDSMSYYDNCSVAIDYLSKLIEWGREKKVNISTYNCRKLNFICDPVAWTVIHGHLKELGIKYDPSHTRYAGGDYLKETADFGDRFRHVHLKGSLIIDGKRFDDPPAGLDQTDWKSFISILYAKNYQGGLSIEPHSKVWEGELGDKGVDFTIDYFKKLLF